MERVHATCEGGCRLGLLVLAGLPGAGKSTLCRRLQGQLGPSLEVVVVSFDDVMHRVQEAAEAHEWSPEQWHASRIAAMHLVSEALSRRVEHSAPASAAASTPDPASASADNTTSPDSACEKLTARGRLVLVDDNSWLRSMRRQLYVAARDAAEPCAFAVLHLSLDADTCIARDTARRAEERVGEATIRKMLAHFEPPGMCNDRCWECVHSTTQNAASPLDELSRDVEVLARALFTTSAHVPARPVEGISLAERQAQRERTMASLSHHADLWLRARVSAFVQGESGGSKRQRAERANAARKHILGAVHSHLSGLHDDDDHEGALKALETWLRSEWEVQVAGGHANGNASASHT
jgi:tRNA uridine 5-carbamoylmethylation protein Kti12